MIEDLENLSPRRRLVLIDQAFEHRDYSHCLDLIDGFRERVDGEISQMAVMLGMRLKELTTQQIEGVLPYEQNNLRKNEILKGLIQLIKEVKEEVSESDEDLPVLSLKMKDGFMKTVNAGWKIVPSGVEVLHDDEELSVIIQEVRSNIEQGFKPYVRIEIEDLGRVNSMIEELNARQTKSSSDRKELLELKEIRKQIFEKRQKIGVWLGFLSKVYIWRPQSDYSGHATAFRVIANRANGPDFQSTNGSGLSLNVCKYPCREEGNWSCKLRLTIEEAEALWKELSPDQPDLASFKQLFWGFLSNWRITNLPDYLIFSKALPSYILKLRQYLHEGKVSLDNAEDWEDFWDFHLGL